MVAHSDKKTHSDEKRAKRTQKKCSNFDVGRQAQRSWFIGMDELQFFAKWLISITSSRVMAENYIVGCSDFGSFIQAYEPGFLGLSNHSTCNLKKFLCSVLQVFCQDGLPRQIL